MEKTCVVCGEVFEARSIRYVTCGHECKKQNHLIRNRAIKKQKYEPVPDIHCSICDKLFHPFNGAKGCSDECRREIKLRNTRRNKTEEKARYHARYPSRKKEERERYYARAGKRDAHRERDRNRYYAEKASVEVITNLFGSLSEIEITIPSEMPRKSEFLRRACKRVIDDIQKQGLEALL